MRNMNGEQIYKAWKALAERSDRIGRRHAFLSSSYAVLDTEFFCNKLNGNRYELGNPEIAFKRIARCFNRTAAAEGGAQ